MGKPPATPRGVTIHRGKLRISFVFRGVRCREGLGLLPTRANIEYARRKRDLVLDDIGLGRFDYLAHFPDSDRANLFGQHRPERVSVGDLLDRWLKSTSLAESTRHDYESAIRYHLKPAFGLLALPDLKKSDVKTWLAGLEISNKRKNNILIPLRGALGDAVDDELIERSPVERLANLEVRQDEPDPLDPDEIERLLAACDGSIQRLWRFAIWTGLRTGELIGLGWEDVDLQRATAKITRNQVKGHWKGPKTAAGERYVDLLDDALDALTQEKAVSFLRPPVEALVWRGGKASAERFRPVWLNPEGSHWINSQQLLRRAWEPTMRRAGLRYRTAYQTRHTYASMLLSWGSNPMYVAAQMGHKDWGMIRKRYGRWIAALSNDQRELIRQAKAKHFNGPSAAPRRVSD
jgi:integrase